jgi:hypothetical protein
LSTIEEHNVSKRDVVPGICILSMYASFYIDPTLEHIAFQPWWCITMVGMRGREFIIWFGGILTGVYLVLVNPNPTAHVMMNLALLFKTRKISIRGRSLVHLICVLIYVTSPTIDSVEYKDFLTGMSAVVCAFVHTQTDHFSLAMVYTSPAALCTVILHAIEINWYRYYYNNHFQRVKNSYYFIYTIAVCLVAYGYNFLEHIPFSVFAASA